MCLRSALQVKVSCHPSWQLLPATFPFFFKPPFSSCDFLVNPLSLLPSCESGKGLGIQGKKRGISLFGSRAVFFSHLFPIPWTFPPAEQWSPNLPPHPTSLLYFPSYLRFPPSSFNNLLISAQRPPQLRLFIPENMPWKWDDARKASAFARERDWTPRPPQKNHSHLLLIDLPSKKKGQSTKEQDVNVQRCTSNTPEPTETHSKISCSFVPTYVMCEECKELITREIYLQVFMTIFHFKRWKAKKEKASWRRNFFF